MDMVEFRPRVEEVLFNWLVEFAGLSGFLAVGTGSEDTLKLLFSLIFILQLPLLGNNHLVSSQLLGILTLGKQASNLTNILYTFIMLPVHYLPKDRRTEPAAKRNTWRISGPQSPGTPAWSGTGPAAGWGRWPPPPW